MGLKLALRSLWTTPFVTLVAIASLALGIGANTAIFTLFHQLLLRPLPVATPDGLVNFSAPGPKPGATSCNVAGGCEDVFSYPMFRDLERVQTAFNGVAAHRSFAANLAFEGQTTHGEGMLVSGSYFTVLGLQAAAGRLVDDSHDRTPGEAPVAVLSHAYWLTRFSADPRIVGRSIVVNGRPLTIIGVAPRGFTGTTLGVRPLLFVPITLRAVLGAGGSGFDDRRGYWAYLFARLRPGVTLDQARASTEGPYRTILRDVEAPLQQGMSDQTMARFLDRPLVIEPGGAGQSSVPDEARIPLVLLISVTLVVLLIACANIANLLLARAAARQGEMAVRLSLGATRAQLVGQLLAEAWLMAILGATAGLVVARWTLDGMMALLPPEAVTTIDPALDPAVLAFAAALALGTGVLFGLFPSLHGTRPNLVSSLKGQAGQTGGARMASRFRTALATAQIGLSMALLASAGLFIESLVNVTREDLGLWTDNLATFRVAPVRNGYPPERSRALFQAIEDELAAQPGVTGVASSTVALLTGSNRGTSVAVEAFQAGPDTDVNASFNEVSPGYFRTMGMQLLAGREFTPGDGLDTPKVAVVNERFAAKFNLGREAVGKRMASGSARETGLDTEIVGIVANAKYSEVRDAVPPLFFRPALQNGSVGSITFYVRTSADPDTLLAGIPRLVAQLDANLPVEELRTMEQQVVDNVFLDRFMGTLSSAFAALATVLAAIGLYGMLAYTVVQRTREIGVRMALGAAPGHVRSLVIGQVLRLTSVGGVIGLTAAYGLARLARSILYGLDGLGVGTTVAAALGLTLVALASGFVPALRASRIDPIRALRYE